MSVLGRLLVSSSERLDLPDLLSIDSYSAGDWRYFLKGIVGDTKPYILKGFDVIDPGNAIGTQSCSIRVADSMTFYPASNAGAFFHGLQEGHAQALPLVPELRKNAVNYIYLTFSTFNTAADTRAFWDPDKDGGVGGEFTQDVNTQSVLKVDVNVSTGSFPANTIPIAKVTVGPVVITAIEDARDMLFRLGSGGINPNPTNSYAWRSLPGSGYVRQEPPTQMLAGGVNPFQGADKNILSLKEWMDAVMSKLRELGGTTYWYDDVSSFSVVNNFFDAVATAFKSKGKWQHDATTPGLLTWTEDIQVKLTSDPRTYIIRQGSKVLTNEQVAYVAMQRNLPINTTDSPVSWVSGQSYVNTIGGAIGLFANLAKGDYVKKVNDTSNKWLRVEEFYDAVNLGGSTTTAANARSIRLNSVYLGSTGNEKGRYDQGSYTSGEVIVSDRDQAAIGLAGGNFHWLAMRSDTIQNISNLVTSNLSINIDQHDGSTARVTSTAHGLVDGDRITITGTTNFNGTYQIEVESVDVFYINLSGGPYSSEAGAAHFTTVTTSIRNTAYGFQEESANHGLNTDDKILISNTTNYNGTYQVSVRSSTSFTIPIAAPTATETAGDATLVRIIARTEGAVTQLIQGQTAEIGGSAAENIRLYTGMMSLAETTPNYSVPISYNTLDGMTNYNSTVGENLTSRISKLTAMMADKAQDKTINILPSNYETITNTTNGAIQDITFNANTPPGRLDVVMPGSDFVAGSILLSGTLSLAVNQVAYIEIDRNTTFSYANISSITVANIIETPIDENLLVLAVRLNTNEVWLWDRTYLPANTTTPVASYIPHVINQNATTKLVDGGTWSWTLGTTSLTWSADAFIQIPGLAETRNTIVAGTASLASSGDCAYVDINRSAGGITNLTVNVGDLSAISLNLNRFVIARRINNDVVVGNHSMLLIDGESKKLYAGISDQSLIYTGQPDAADSTPTYTNVTNGLSSYPVIQGDDLTLSIGQTIGNVNDILTTLDQPSYDEYREIVASSPTGNQMLGPVTSGTTIILPTNSRLGGSPAQFYVVDKGALEIYLNGQILQLGVPNGWTQLGVSGSDSNQIQINQQLEIGDILSFRIDATGGPGAGGGGGGAPDDNFVTLPTSITADNADYLLIYDVGDSAYRKQTRSTFLAGVSNILNVNSYSVDHTADVTNDDVILVNATAAIRTITLPLAGTAEGKVFYIKKTDASANTVIIDGGAANIDGASTLTITLQYESYTITCDGTAWWIL